MTTKFKTFNRWGSLFASLAFGLGVGACERSVDSGAADRNGQGGVEDGDDEDDDGGGTPMCDAAEAIDDACEAVNGEDVAACAPFDAIDEACEAGNAD